MLSNKSYLKWRNKIIQCPNYSDKTKKQKFVGFLDIPFDNINFEDKNQVEISDIIRKTSCHPCCYSKNNRKL